MNKYFSSYIFWLRKYENYYNITIINHAERYARDMLGNAHIKNVWPSSLKLAVLTVSGVEFNGISISHKKRTFFDTTYPKENNDFYRKKGKQKFFAIL